MFSLSVSLTDLQVGYPYFRSLRLEKFCGGKRMWFTNALDQAVERWRRVIYRLGRLRLLRKRFGCLGWFLGKYHPDKTTCQRQRLWWHTTGLHLQKVKALGEGREILPGAPDVAPRFVAEPRFAAEEAPEPEPDQEPAPPTSTGGASSSSSSTPQVNVQINITIKDAGATDRGSEGAASSGGGRSSGRGQGGRRGRGSR